MHLSMIFKFFKQDKTQPDEAAVETVTEGSTRAAAGELPTDVVAANDTAAPEPRSSAAAASGGPVSMPAAAALGADELRRATDPSIWDGLGSADLEPLGCLAAQQEALNEIGFALGGAPVEAGSVVLPPGGGLWSHLSEHVRGLAAERSVPADWVYVASLTDVRRLAALPLPPGRGRAFAAGMAAALDELAFTIPAALSGDDHTLRRETIAEEVRLAVEEPLEDLRTRAKAQNVAMLRTPAGYTLAPMHEGKVVRPELFAQLPAPMQREVEVRVASLERELETMLQAVAGAERARRRRLQDLEAESVRPHVDAAFADLEAQLTDADEAVAHVVALKDEIVAYAAVARPGATESGLARYVVEMAAALPHGHEVAPFVEAVQPTRERLSGSVKEGSVVPGLLHRAYGGVLLVDARDLVADAGARETITAALRTRHVLPCAVGHGPVADPIPLAITIIIAGDRIALDRLAEADTGLIALAPIVADLTHTVTRAPETEKQAARVITAQVRESGLTPLEGGALARLVEECARLGGLRDRLLAGSESIVRLAAESGARARKAGRTAATREDVTQAIAARSSRAKRGAANALALGGPSTTGSVISVVGAPCETHTLARIIARAGPSRARSGRIALVPHGRDGYGHALSGYLAGRFGLDATAALSATLSAEGTSEAARDPLTGAASLAALLSAVGEIPVSQRLAVIGGIDAGGLLRATPGIDDAIEAVHARALDDSDGPSGVIVPTAVRHLLMLCEAVARSVAAGRFSVSTAENVDDVLVLVAEGKESAESIHQRIAAGLEGFVARRAQA